MKQMLTRFFPVLNDQIELPVYTTLFLAHPTGPGGSIEGKVYRLNRGLREILKRINNVKDKKLYIA